MDEGRVSQTLGEGLPSTMALLLDEEALRRAVIRATAHLSPNLRT
jgi:hypothetical protein